MSSIKTKLIALVLLISVVPLIILGVASYLQTTEIFTKSIQDSLLTIVKAKADALEDYIDTTNSAGLGIATTDAMQNFINFKANPEMTEAGELARFNTIRNQVENLIYSFQEAHWGKYHHVFLINRAQKIIISPNHGVNEKGSPSSHLNEDTTGNHWARQALTLGKATVSDFSSWVESDHIHQMLFYPVNDSQGVTRAVIGFELQIPHEQKLLTQNLNLGETGKVYLATTNGIPIVYKGMENETAINSPGVTEAQRVGLSTGRRLNAEGVEVIDLYLKNEKYPWILVAEIETKEAFNKINTLQKYVLVAFVITIIAAFIFSVLFSNYIVNPLKRLTKQMEMISLGKFDVELDDIDRNDEIGAMVKAFDRTVISLKIAMQRYAKLKSKNDLNNDNDRGL